MANEIDLIVGSEAFAQITKLLVELGKVDASFTELSTKFAALGNNTNTVKSTADLAKLTAENAKLNAVIEQQIKDFADLNEKLAKVTVTRASSTKGITEETIAQRELNKETTLNIKATTEVAGAYAKLDAQHKLAVKSAQDLAASTGRGTIEYEKAKLKANELGQQLKVIDTDIGKHTRNVGNYSSSWNGLGNSINQLTREAPAFANSVQTGFMALSNNIPILTDELNVLIQKNKDLQAEGKPTQSILKTVAGAFFSWQTAISLGVTILTVYGAKLVDMARGLGDVKKETDKLIASQAKLDKSVADVTTTILHNAQLQIDKAKLRNASQKEQDDILLNAQKQVLKQLEIAENTSAEKKYQAAKKYRDALANESGIIINQYSSREDKIRKQKEQADIAALAKTGKVTDEQFKILEDAHVKRKDAVIKQGYVISELTSSQQVSQHEASKKNQKDIDKENAKNDKLEEEKLKNAFERKISDLEKQKDIDSDALDSFSGVLQERQILSGKVAADEVKIVEAKYEEELRLADGNADLIAIAENNKFIAINNIRDENIKRVQDMYKKEEDAQAESLKTQLDEQKRQSALLRELEDIVDKDEKDKLKKKADYLKSFADEFASNSGLTETFKMMSGQIEGFGTDTKVTFNAVAEASQEMFNKIAQYSMANYEGEYKRLDAQKEASLKFTGDSVASKEKIEADYAKKKKEIEKRQFEDEKKISMVNIVIDTAQAVVATLAKGGGFFSTPLAMIVAAMGAAQLGLVAAQQFPAYAEGTDNHRGGMMLVNDGTGSNYQEKVVLPSGKVIRPQGRNVLMNAPKGTKVLNHEQQLFEMLQSNNISMSSPQYQGMTPDEMDEILGKHFSNIKTQNTIFDKNGFQSYVKNGNSITRSNSNRSQAIGISV